MRLAPIEQPKSLKLRIAYRMIRKRLGKVITPAKVVYARVPETLKLAKALADLQESGIKLDQEIAFLVKTYVAGINKCAFCVDIGQAMAMQSGMDLTKFNHLHEYKTHPGFTARERAALDYVDEATRNKTVSDATFARLQEHFNEREVVEITILNAIENFYNLMNLPLEIESDGLCVFPAKPVNGARANNMTHV